jgi:hypothetical protein
MTPKQAEQHLNEVVARVPVFHLIPVNLGEITIFFSEN